MLKPCHKSSLRRTLRHQRSQQSKHLKRRAAQQIVQNFKRSPYARSQTIAGYIAFAGELDLNLCFKTLAKQRCKIFVPVVRLRHTLWFVPYRPGEPLRYNRYGIAEPKHKRRPRPAWSLATVLLPLLGFDKKGHRLGSGGGYYDRCFAFKKRRLQRARPHLIGVAYDWQKVQNLPHDPWDVVLDGVLTPTNITMFNS